MIDALLGIATGTRPQAGEGESTADDGTNGHPHTQKDGPTISYAIRGEATLVNCWEDPHYFTAAFPTLFPSGIGGHLDQRTVPVSLVAFSEWVLNHRRRRHVVPTSLCKSPLTLVDSLAIKPSCTFSTIVCSWKVRSSLGHTLLVKRQNWKSTSDDIAFLTVDQLEDEASTLCVTLLYLIDDQ